MAQTNGPVVLCNDDVQSIAEHIDGDDHMAGSPEPPSQQPVHPLSNLGTTADCSHLETPAHPNTRGKIPPEPSRSAL